MNRLADSYELVWASGWEERANDHLPGILGVPELPYLGFDGKARFGSAHWKLPVLEEYAGERPLAWIDDSLDPSCYEWAEARQAPTLLVPTDPAIGLEEVTWPRSSPGRSRATRSPVEASTAAAVEPARGAV